MDTEYYAVTIPTLPQSLTLEGKWALNNVNVLLENEKRAWKGVLLGLPALWAGHLWKALLKSEGR